MQDSNEKKQALVQLEPQKPLFPNFSMTLAKETTAIPFTIYSEVCNKTNIPYVGNVLGAIPTVAFGLVENIKKGSSRWSTVVDIGVDVGIGIVLALPAQGILKASEIASAQTAMTEEYLGLFTVSNDINSNYAYDMSDEAERLFERQLVHGFAIPYQTIQVMKNLISDPGKFFSANPSSMKKMADPSREGTQTFYKPSFNFSLNTFDKQKIVFPNSDFLSHQTIFSAPFNPEQLMEINPLSKVFDLNKFSLISEGNNLKQPTYVPAKLLEESVYNPAPDLKTIDTINQDAFISKLESTPVVHPPKAPVYEDKGFGTITPHMQFIPNGLQMGFTSTNNASGMQVDINFQLEGVADLLDEAGNRFFCHVNAAKGEIIIANRKYSYTIDTVGGHFYKLKIRLKDKVTGKKSHSYVNLKRFAIEHKKNQPRIMKSFDVVVGRALKKRFPSFEEDQKQYPAKIQEAMIAKNFDLAFHWFFTFKGKYQDIPGVDTYCNELKTNIEYHLANNLIEQGIQELGRNDKISALKCFIQAQTLLPNHSELALEIAHLNAENLADNYVEEGKKCEAAGKNQEAELLYKKAQAEVSNHLAASLALSDLFSKSNQINAAILQMELVVTMYPEYQLHLNLLKKHQMAEQNVQEGDKLLAEGNYEGAQLAYKEAKDHVPNHFRATIALVNIHKQFKDYSEAITQMEEIVKIKPECQSQLQELKNLQIASQLVLAGNQSALEGKLEDAENFYQKAQDYVTNHPAAMIASINLLIKSANFQAAIGKMEILAASDVEYLPLLKQLKAAFAVDQYIAKGKEFAKNGETDFATEAFEKAQDYGADYPQATLALVNHLVMNQNLSRAIVELHKIANLSAEYEDYLNCLQNENNAMNYTAEANALAFKGQQDKAIELYKKARESVPNHLEATLALVKFSIEANNLDEAIQYLKPVVDLNPSLRLYLDNITLLYQANNFVAKGDDFFKEGNAEEAKKAYEVAQSLVPAHVNAALGLAEIYAQEADFSKAILEVKKLPPSIEMMHYVERLNIHWLHTRATPLLNVFSQILDEHIERDLLHPRLYYPARIVSAIQHCHPDFLISIPSILKCDPLVREDWIKVLKEKDFISIASAVGVMQSLKVLNLSEYVPYSQKITSLLSFAQQGQLAYNLAQDLGILKTNAKKPGLNLAYKNGSLGLAISTFGTKFLLYWYDKKYHQGLMPETAIECLKRDSIGLITSFIQSLMVRPVLIPWHLLATFISPFLKKTMGIYDSQSKDGLLANARHFLLKTDAAAALEATRRYNQLPEYKVELEFKHAVLFDPNDLDRFRFSPSGGNKTICAQIALHFLCLAMSSDQYFQSSESIRNKYLHTVRKLMFVLPKTEDAIVITAKQLYALALSSTRYLNTILAQLDAIRNHNNKELAQCGILVGVSDLLIKYTWASKVLGDKMILPELIKRQGEIKSQHIYYTSITLQFSSGKTQAGFGQQLTKLIIDKNKLSNPDFNFEMKMLNVLSYLFADLSDINLIKVKMNEKLAAEELISIIQQSKQTNLQRLAYILLNKLTSDTDLQLHKSHSDSLPFTKELELDPQLKINLSKLPHIALENSAVDSKNPLHLMNYAYMLMSKGLKASGDVIPTALLQEFSEPYEISIQNKDLVSFYLSAMIMFLYLVKILSEPCESSIKTQQLHYEILDSILLRGYLPPFSTLMARTIGYNSITEEQSLEVLSWYGIKLDTLTAPSKLDLLVSMLKANPDLKGIPKNEVGAFCQQWGNLIRKAVLCNKLEENILIRVFWQKSEDAFIEYFKQLLIQGANPNLITVGDRDILLLPFAVERRFSKLVALLCKYGAKIDIIKDKMTPLQLAVIEFLKNPKDTFLKKIIEDLSNYGASWVKPNKFVIMDGSSWWYYGGLSAEKILQPYPQIYNLLNLPRLADKLNRTSFLSENFDSVPSSTPSSMKGSFFDKKPGKGKEEKSEEKENVMKP